MRRWKTGFWKSGQSEKIAFGMQNDQMCKVTAPKFRWKFSQARGKLGGCLSTRWKIFGDFFRVFPLV